MTAIDDSVFDSAPFKFLIDGSPLYIHRDLIARHSVPLYRMIHGQMSEAMNGFAVIDGLGEGVFRRFICWAYTEVYPAAEFSEDTAVSTAHQSNLAVRVSVSRSARRPKVLVAAQGDPSGIVCTTPDFKSSAFDLLPEELFLRRKYPVPKTMIGPRAHRANQGPREDYTNVFLSHARLYVFADKYDIQPLKMLALHNLHSTLVIYTLYPERIGDIIALIEYCYENSGAVEDEGDVREVHHHKTDGLRQLVIDYVRWYLDALVKNSEFRTFLCLIGGDILDDVLKLVAERI